MINPTTVDIDRRVVCKFQKGEIAGRLERFDNDSVFIKTVHGEQAFSRDEVTWEGVPFPKADKPAAAPAE